jgi:diguanylate cyclase (GGDEF)-like protein
VTETTTRRGGDELVDRWTALVPTIDPWTARSVVRALQHAGTGADVADALLRFDPDLVLTLPQLSALREVLRGALDGDTDEALMLSDALDDLVVRIAAREVSRLEALTLLDPLTGVGNRRAADADLHRALTHAARHDRVVSIAVVDLDGLKRVNDEQGHEAGDEAIRALATALRSSARVDDGVYRTGGDELLVIAADSTAGDLERLVARVRAIAPAFSAGIASAPTDATEAAELLQHADRLLYEQKASRSGARPEAADAPPPAPAWTREAAWSLPYVLAAVLAESTRRIVGVPVEGAATVLWTLLLVGGPAVAALGDRTSGRVGSWTRAAVAALALVSILIPLSTLS